MVRQKQSNHLHSTLTHFFSKINENDRVDFFEKTQDFKDFATFFFIFKFLHLRNKHNFDTISLFFVNVLPDIRFCTVYGSPNYMFFSKTNAKFSICTFFFQTHQSTLNSHGYGVLGAPRTHGKVSSQTPQ